MTLDSYDQILKQHRLPDQHDLDQPAVQRLLDQRQSVSHRRLHGLQRRRADHDQRRLRLRHHLRQRPERRAVADERRFVHLHVDGRRQQQLLLRLVTPAASQSDWPTFVCGGNDCLHASTRTLPT